MPSSASDSVPRIGVGVIILRGKKVLLGRRKGPRGSGTYGLPGGYLENNETFEECAMREVLEETGLNCLLFHPIYLITGLSDNSHYADVIFYTSCEDGEPVAIETNRVENWEWFNIFSLPSPLYSPTKITLKNFVKNYRFHKINLFFQKWLPSERITILYFDSMGT